MAMRQRKLVLALCGAAAGSAGLASSAPGDIGFPEGYRRWTHVKSAIGHPPPGDPPLRFDGIHHIYANEAAIEGYRSGTFADGAVLVFDRFGIEESKLGIEPSKRLSIDVMVRDSKRFAANGGWGFERFDADGRGIIDEVERQQCVSCHRRVEDRAMVFSRFEDPQAAGSAP